MKRVHHIVLIVLACVVVYANSLNVPFQWDGTYFIKENPAVRDLSYFTDLSRPMSADLHQALKMRWVGYLTFALNHRTFGFRPWAFHLDNIALHAANALLVYMLIVLLWRTPLLASAERSRLRDVPALFAALLFAVHPLQTEAVTYIFQRLAALAAFFYLASAVLYIWARLATGGRQGMALYGLSLVCAVLAMKTKENAFTLPFALLLIEVLFFKETWKRRKMLLAPFMLTLFIIPLSLTGLDRPVGDIIASLGPSTRGAKEFTRSQYFLSQFPVLAEYLRLLVLPVGQTLDHAVTVETSPFSLRVLAPMTMLVGLFAAGGACLWKARLQRAGGPLLIAAFGIFWFFLTISVESSIIPIPQLMAEYRMYLPSVGLIMAATTGVFHLARSPRARLALSIALTACALVLGGATVARNFVWRDGRTLWNDVLAKNPRSIVGHNNLGLSLMGAGLNGPAMEHFQKAIELSPAYADPYLNLGVAYGNIGRPKLAIEYYRKAIELDPKLVGAYNNMGNAFRDLGIMDQAVASYRTALALEPAFAEAHNNLGVALARSGHTEEAFRHFSTAIRLRPEFAGAHFNLGVLYLQTGKPAAARRELETALRLSPGDAQAEELLKTLATDNR